MTLPKETPPKAPGNKLVVAILLALFIPSGGGAFSLWSLNSTLTRVEVNQENTSKTLDDMEKRLRALESTMVTKADFPMLLKAHAKTD